MFERLIAYHILELLKKSLEEIIQRSERIRFADDFLSSNEGVILLDSICMKLSAVGESVKNLDKITKREFLSNYPEDASRSSSVDYSSLYSSLASKQGQAFLI